MPNCFQLIRNEEAVPLNQVDEEMCRHFDAPCDEHRYYWYWYDVIGYDLAMGDTFDEIIARYPTAYPEAPELVAIARWLQANFTTRSWTESSSLRGRGRGDS
jgi:hypothetical protein